VKAPLLIVVGVLVVGAAVRIAGGVPLVQTDLLMGSPAPGPESGSAGRAPGDTSPESAAASFYEFVQKGEYDKAWDVALEPDWSGSAAGASYLKEVSATPRPAGWTGESEFVSRCNDDIGSGIKLNGIQVVRLESAPDSPEARAAKLLGASRLVGVRASGQMLGACLIYRWDRNLVVAQVGGHYKVVLPGTKASRSLFHQEWFSNLFLVGALRASGK
jgi:hypothetical protein